MDLKDLQIRYLLIIIFDLTDLDQFSSQPDDVDYRIGDNPATEFITEAINHAFEKLKKYYDLTDRSP